MEERKCVYINWLVLLLSCGEKRWRRTCIDYLHFYGTFSETESVASKPMRRSFYFCGGMTLDLHNKSTHFDHTHRRNRRIYISFCYGNTIKWERIKWIEPFSKHIISYFER